jgi:hypothetical protein
VQRQIPALLFPKGLHIKRKRTIGKLPMVLLYYAEEDYQKAQD